MSLCRRKRYCHKPIATCDKTANITISNLWNMSFRSKKSGEIWEKEVEMGRYLVEYATKGDYEKVSYCLRETDNVDAVDYNRTLFYKSQNYRTPLQCAASEGHGDILKLLLRHKADANVKDRYDCTAVHMAASKGHLKCLRILLAGGADPNVATKMAKQGSYTVPFVGGTTPLHLAALNNHVKCIRELILNGADYNATDDLGRTSLYVAADEGFEDCVLAHLNNVVGRDILSLPVKDSADTPLHRCVAKNLYKATKALLSHGSDAMQHNHCGYTPLHLSVLNRDGFDPRIVKEIVLSSYSIDLNRRDLSGHVPLQYVCFNDHARQERRPKVAAFLIALGADYRRIRSRLQLSLLEYELRIPNMDYSVLETIVATMATVPPLRALGVVEPHISALIHRNELMMKFQWWKDLTRFPRSLQQICRFVIRRQLGKERLRHVFKLTLPLPLKQYLLLDYDMMLHRKPKTKAPTATNSNSAVAAQLQPEMPEHLDLVDEELDIVVAAPPSVAMVPHLHHVGVGAMGAFVQELPLEFQ